MKALYFSPVHFYTKPLEADSGIKIRMEGYAYCTISVDFESGPLLFCSLRNYQCYVAFCQQY